MLGNIERHYSAYTSDQLFDLVADVEKYSEFLPWVRSSRIVRREPNAVWVDMVLGIGPLQMHFGSHAALYPPHAIEITSSDAPFLWFGQRWEFGTAPDGHAVVGYRYEFSLRPPVLELISDAALDGALRATINAFEDRARQIYGTRAAPAGPQSAHPVAAGAVTPPSPLGFDDGRTP
jgi:coenzyme Q-binding protein COQ10